jgi:hypothetical protein
MKFIKGFEKAAFFEETKKKYDKKMGKGAHKKFEPDNPKHVKALLKAQNIKY